MHRSLFLLPFLLTACPDPKADDTAITDTDGEGCDVQIDETIPVTGAIDADYRSSIEFHLSDPDPTATASSSVAGQSWRNADNDVVYFTPDAPLSPSTPYTVDLTYCGGTASISFTTSALGTSISDPEGTLKDKTYELLLSDARIVEPDGIGSVLSSYLTQAILVGVVSVDTEIQMMGAIGVEDATPAMQDYCDPTIPFPSADFSEQPFFQIGPETTTLSVAGYNITIEDLAISGTFASDGTYFGGGELSGTIDTRPLDPLLSETGEEGAICDLAVSFGAACEACPSDGELFCLTLVADQIQANVVNGVTLAEVVGNDCEGCEAGPPAPDAVCADDTAP